MTNSINIPVDIAPFLFKNKLRKAFRLFVALKCNNYSRINNLKEVLKKCASVVGLKYRTLVIYFNQLVAIKWIGKDNYGNYFVRSMKFIRSLYKNITRRAVGMKMSDISKGDAFITAAYLTHLTKNQQTVNWIYRNKRRKSRVSTISDDAKQRDYLNSLNYYGISSAGLAIKLGISRSVTQRLIQRAQKLRYIKIKRHKRVVLKNVTQSDIKALKRSFTHDNHKLIARETRQSKKVKFKFEPRFNLFEQLHNEIKSNLTIKPLKTWFTPSSNVSAQEYPYHLS